MTDKDRLKYLLESIAREKNMPLDKRKEQTKIDYFVKRLYPNHEVVMEVRREEAKEEA